MENGSHRLLAVLGISAIGPIFARGIAGAFHVPAREAIRSNGLQVFPSGRGLQARGLQLIEGIDGIDPMYANCVPYGGELGWTSYRQDGLWLCPTPGLTAPAGHVPLPSLPPLPIPDSKCILVNRQPLFDDEAAVTLYYCGEDDSTTASASPDPGGVTPSPPATRQPQASPGTGGGTAGDSMVFAWSRVYYVTATVTVRLGSSFDLSHKRAMVALNDAKAVDMMHGLREALATLVGLPARAVVLRRIAWPDQQLSAFSLLHVVNTDSATNFAMMADDSPDDGSGSGAGSSTTPGAWSGNTTVLRFRLRILTSELTGCGLNQDACVNRTLTVMSKLSGDGTAATGAQNMTAASVLMPWLAANSAFFCINATQDPNPSNNLLVDGQTVAGYGPNGVTVVLAVTPSAQPWTPGDGSSGPSSQGGIIVGIALGSVLGVATVLVAVSSATRNLMAKRAAALASSRAEAVRRARLNMPGLGPKAQGRRTSSTPNGPRKRLADVAPAAAVAVPVPRGRDRAASTADQSRTRTASHGHLKAVDKPMDTRVIKTIIDSKAPLATVKARTPSTDGALGPSRGGHAAHVLRRHKAMSSQAGGSPLPVGYGGNGDDVAGVSTEAVPGQQPVMPLQPAQHVAALTHLHLHGRHTLGAGGVHVVTQAPEAGHMSPGEAAVLGATGLQSQEPQQAAAHGGHGSPGTGSPLQSGTTTPNDAGVASAGPSAGQHNRSGTVVRHSVAFSGPIHTHGLSWGGASVAYLPPASGSGSDTRGPSHTGHKRSASWAHRRGLNSMASLASFGVAEAASGQTAGANEGAGARPSRFRHGSEHSRAGSGPSSLSCAQAGCPGDCYGHHHGVSDVDEGSPDDHARAEADAAGHGDGQDRDTVLAESRSGSVGSGWSGWWAGLKASVSAHSRWGSNVSSTGMQQGGASGGSAPGHSRSTSGSSSAGGTIAKPQFLSPVAIFVGSPTQEHHEEHGAAAGAGGQHGGAQPTRNALERHSPVWAEASGSGDQSPGPSPGQAGMTAEDSPGQYASSNGGRQWLQQLSPPRMSPSPSLSPRARGARAGRTRWRPNLHLVLEGQDQEQDGQLGDTDDDVQDSVGAAATSEESPDPSTEGDASPQPQDVSVRMAAFVASLPGRARDAFVNADAYARGLIVGPDQGRLVTIPEQPSIMTAGGTDLVTGSSRHTSSSSNSSGNNSNSTGSAFSKSMSRSVSATGTGAAAADAGAAQPGRAAIPGGPVRATR